MGYVLYAVQPQITHPVRRLIITLIPSLAWRGVCIAWHSDGGAEGRKGRAEGEREGRKRGGVLRERGGLAGGLAGGRMYDCCSGCYGYMDGCTEENPIPSPREHAVESTRACVCGWVFVVPDAI